MSLFSLLLRGHSRPWLGLALLFASPVLMAATTPSASVESPGKILKVTLQVDGGTARYQVERLGDAVVDASKLGFELRDGRLDRDFEITGSSTRAFDETWEQPWGERRLTRNHYNELTASLGQAPRSAGSSIGPRCGWTWCSGYSTTAWACATCFRSSRDWPRRSSMRS